MQTHHPRSTPSSAPSTRERILAAAARVFARDGLDGATTRAIAQEADVNEVTLFRHFKSKERLLAAVVGDNFGPAGALAMPEIPKPTGDIRHDLLEMAKYYDRLYTAHLPLLRTMIGEIHRHREHERQVLSSIFSPVREALEALLKRARETDAMHVEADVEILSDLFAGMIFMGVLKRNTPHITRHYAHAAYLQTVVDVMLRGTTGDRSS